MTHDIDNEDRIRERAHAIWLQEGQPSGREHEHWEQAKAEIENSSAQTDPDLPGSPGGAGDGIESTLSRPTSRPVATRR